MYLIHKPFFYSLSIVAILDDVAFSFQPAVAAKKNFLNYLFWPFDKFVVII
jgi:hypothetical protein